MAERSVRVRLTAVIDDYRRAMGDAAKATGQVGDAAQDAEKKSSRIGDAARGAGRVAVTGLAIATTATAGLGLAALKTGIQYNALEQTSRAALTTLLGSSEAAADQMERLREFVRTSPFPREVWIQAQQTLLAFGMEARDIIPTLDAIQDAAAAAGLSTAEIGGLVDVFARIQSSGRITGVELRQFAIRGIDAAALLGQAYGKTADQIRQDITSGAIDGREALTVLTQQMTETFGGAAENVRQTWAGATDSLRGAFRDVGSIIAAPFVDPMGGGAAVDWARGLADALRALEGVLGPVVANLAERVGPAFQSVTDTLERASEAMRNADVDRVTEQLSRFTPAVAALGAAGLTASAGALPFLGRFASIMVPGGPLTAGIAAFVLAVPEARDLLRELLEAFAPLIEVVIQLATAALPALADAVAIAADVIRPVAGVVGAVGDSVQWWADRLVDLDGALRDSTPAIDEWGASLDRNNASLASILSITGKVGESYSDYKDRTREAAEAHSFWEAPLENTRQKLWEILGIVEPAGEGTKQFGQSTGEAGKEAARAAGGVDEFGNALGDAAIAAEEADEQLQSYLETVKRATDPVYALHGALGDVEKAQDDYNKAVEEYGPQSKQAQDAAFNLMRQLDNLEAAAISGELSFEEFEARLDEWVRQGKITGEQADATRGRVRELRGEAEDYTGRYNATISQTGADATMRKIRDVKSLVESFKNKGITLTVNAQTGSFRIIGRGFAGSLAEGGPVFGGGTSTSDSVPAWLSRGEHVWTAKEVSNAGGHEAVAAIRDHFRFAKGGGLGELNIRHAARDPRLFATDFSDRFGRTLGRDAARAGKTLASVTPGRVLPRGSYRIGMPYLGYPGHYGADYPAPPMTPVYAMAAGMVERAMRMATSYGNHIFLRHANGIQTRYAHMLGLRATAGQAVGPGQHIGWVGSTGNSTGPHLHFEYRRNGAPINPATLGIFDRGGVLPAGGVGANTSSKPEAVLTDRQWATMHAAAAGGGGVRDVRVSLDISGDGAQAEAFRASVRKGDIRISVDGKPAKVN